MPPPCVDWLYAQIYICVYALNKTRRQEKSGFMTPGLNETSAANDGNELYCHHMYNIRLLLLFYDNFAIIIQWVGVWFWLMLHTIEWVEFFAIIIFFSICILIDKQNNYSYILLVELIIYTRIRMPNIRAKMAYCTLYLKCAKCVGFI